MIRGITYKYFGFCVAFLLATTVNAKAALTSNENCPAKFQVRHFQPRLCYSEYDQNSCNDICAAATPARQPACFKEITLPCDIVVDMHATAKGYQQEGDEAWFHVSDILFYPPLYTELYVFQASLHHKLYQDYINTPTAYSFTPASDELRRQNFRLNLLDRLERKATALRYAAVYRRYSFGIELETRLNETFVKMMTDIDEFPYFSAADKQHLKSELNQSQSRQAVFN